MIENIQQTAGLFAIIAFIVILSNPEADKVSYPFKLVVVSVLFISLLVALVTTIARIWS